MARLWFMVLCPCYSLGIDKKNYDIGIGMKVKRDMEKKKKKKKEGQKEDCLVTL